MVKLNLMIIFAMICGIVAGQTQPAIDTLAFVNYLKKNGQEPKSFMLDKLAKHKLVIYGEAHKRKASWDLMKSVIKAPSFSKNTGFVFLEMSSHKQAQMDKFFANKKMDKEILLDILRDVQSEGWDDRGMYEFIIDLWNLNKKLVEKDRIKVILADIARPFSEIKTKEDLNNFMTKTPERNTEMADIIEKSLKSSNDKRGGLFIVGFAHVFKVKLKMGDFSWISAGAQLKERFSEKDVYLTCPHCGVLDNLGNKGGLTNNGIFDYAFARNGNKPVAFDLAGSPFGKGDFDVIMGFETDNFQNNYDGYIFFMPLKDEGAQYLLPELITEDFINELQRRARVFDSVGELIEYGVNLKNITMDDVKRYYQKKAQEKYWDGLKY